MAVTLAAHLPVPGRDGTADPDDVLDAFTAWATARGLTLYPAQEEAVLEICSGANVILATAPVPITLAGAGESA